MNDAKAHVELGIECRFQHLLIFIGVGIWTKEFNFKHRQMIESAHVLVLFRAAQMCSSERERDGSSQFEKLHCGSLVITSCISLSHIS